MKSIKNLMIISNVYNSNKINFLILLNLINLILYHCSLEFSNLDRFKLQV
jgi:hypothetical protein